MGGEGRPPTTIYGRIFSAMWKFLQFTGFVDEHEPADRRWPVGRKLRIDQPLMVAEGLRRAIFPEADPVLLAGLMAGFVNDRETDEHLDKKSLPQVLLKTVSRVVHELRGFAKYMQSRGFTVRPLFFKPMAAVWAWADGQPWDKVVRNLRHMAALQQVFPTMAANARKAIDLILRDPVIPEYEVFTTPAVTTEISKRQTDINA
jgi:ATP-dependent RNA helicase HelY